LPDSEEPINLRRQYEIRLGESIDGVRPCGDFDLAPSQQDVGMMTLLLGNFSDFIYKSECGFKVGEFVSADEMMLVDDIPLCSLGQLTMNLFEFVSL
jgi:hypothetical protein